jgi:hypothetical protein
MQNHEITSLRRKLFGQFREMNYLLMEALVDLHPALYHQWQEEDNLLTKILFCGPEILKKKMDFTILNDVLKFIYLNVI